MKALFAFTGGSVLTEELGDGTEQYEVSNRLFSPGISH
jgi:hypothetical protein